MVTETTKFGGMVSADNPFLYSGYFYDSESELYYLNSRHYAPSIGRFMQEDSYKGDILNPLSLNIYTYAYNNPIRYYDPTGHYVSPTDKANLTSLQIAGLENLNVTEENQRNTGNENPAVYHIKKYRSGIFRSRISIFTTLTTFFC